MPEISRTRLADNVSGVRDRIDEAARRSGRDPGEIKLIAVTKYVDAETTRALIETGLRSIGESRPQVMWEKAGQLGGLEVEWHLIGHLQRNKVRRSIACCRLIHSVDSLRLLQAINDLSDEQKSVSDCLLQVNLSGEAAKHGLQPEEVESVLAVAGELAFVRINGLMGMAGLAGGVAEQRAEFGRLRELRDQFSFAGGDNIQLRELSMGMSSDFEIAIAEGSTMVRIGSILFEGV